MKASLRERLGALPDKARKAAFEALRAEAVRIGGIMKMRVPRRTGRLANSFKIVHDEKNLSVRIEAGGKATTVKARKGFGSFDYSKAVEYGTREAHRQSFFWPVFKKERRAAKKTVVKAIVGALEP